MLRLFIENKEIELTDDVQVAITKQFEDLSNPTAIINDWSKTVSIPFTANNNRIFGHIYNPNKLTTYVPSTNIIGSTPNSQKKWALTNGGGFDYVVDNTLYSNGVITYSDTPVEWLQVGFQYSDWKYSHVKNYRCTDDFHSFEFIYNATEDYRFEFSFRKEDTNAPNQEVCFIQWNLYNKGLVEGKTYIVSFRHKKVGGTYTISDISLTEKQSMTGINFNPLLKLDFRLEWNGAVLMTGYAKMNSIKQVKGKGTYDVTLFGQLGKVFQEMKKITFDTTTNDTTYLIDGSKYVKEYITKDLVYNSWTREGGDIYVDFNNNEIDVPIPLKEKGQSGYSVHDIIGFAPNNAINEGFDYTCYQNKREILKFTDTLGDSFTRDTGVNPDAAIPKGMMPREIGEYRSYLQLPYIYWNKLFQIFQKKAEAITGYEFELDSDWFKSSNPYWGHLVYMLKPFKVDKDDSSKHNQYTMREHGDMMWTSSNWSAEKYLNLMAYSANEQLPIVNGISPSGVTQAVFTIPSEDSAIKVNFEVPFMIQQAATYKNSNRQHKRLNGMLELRVSLVNQDDTEIACALYKVRPSNFDTNDNYLDYTKLVVIEDNGAVSEETGSYDFWYFTVKDGFLVTPYLYGSDASSSYNNTSFYITYTAQWYDANGDVLTTSPILNVAESAAATGTVYLRERTDAYVTMDITETLKRSFSVFTLNNLWNKDFNLFDVILNYCKMHRIYITVDDVNKKIKFLRHDNLFKDYRILDWTDKVDKSKDFILKPVAFDKKYVLFNYKDNKTSLGEEYKKKYGVNYGDYKLTTDYNFNTEEEKLFKDIPCSIISTNNILSWSVLEDITPNSIVYSFPPEKYIYNRDKDDKAVDVFGSYYFHNGYTAFSTELALHLRSVYLTDDTDIQVTNNTYCYAQRENDFSPIANRVHVTTYPKLDIVYGNNLCTFNVPSENYTYQQNYAGKKSIYTNFWEDYINERYNIQNKVLTCYLKLTPSDFVTFNWNCFVKIDNQLYIVNKIYDYDITSSGTTKVDLITVQDIKAYVGNNTEWDGTTTQNNGGGNSGGGNSEELG